MRRVISALLLAGFALPAGFAQSAWADTISVALDEVQTIAFPSVPAAVNVGNPSIADITMFDDHHAFIQGKAYGSTNMVAVDKNGGIISNTHINVLSGQQAIVTLQRGASRTTYTCIASRCEPSPQPGDGKDSFDAASGQITAHQDTARKAAMPQADK
jgi:hypothetical protein